MHVSAGTVGGSDMRLPCSNDAEACLLGEQQVSPNQLSDRSRHLHATTRHYYVDVPDPHESNYEACEQHVSIDPTFKEVLEKDNEGDISQFLCLPELIPAKKRKRQQPLLDYTHSRILTSQDYMQGLEDLVAKKEANAAAAKKKKDEKEASKEQRKLAKEQQQRKKEMRAAERAQKRQEKAAQQNARQVPGGGRRGGGGASRSGARAARTAGEAGVVTGEGAQQSRGYGMQPAAGVDIGGSSRERQTTSTSRFAVDHGADVSVSVPAFRASRPPCTAPPTERALAHAGDGSFTGSHPPSRALLVHTVPRRWTGPAAPVSSPLPPPEAPQDTTPANLTYLQVIQGLQRNFYNPQVGSPFTPHSQAYGNVLPRPMQQGEDQRTVVDRESDLW